MCTSAGLLGAGDGGPGRQSVCSMQRWSFGVPPLEEDPFSSTHFQEPVAFWRKVALRLLSGHARDLLQH